MIIFGTRGSRQTEIPTGHTCTACGKENSVFLVPFQRYFHIFWIPVLPIGKENVIICGDCGATFVPEKYPLSEEVKNQMKTPVWTFAGLFLIGLLILSVVATGISGDNEKKNNIATRLDSPQKGDIYYIKADKKDYRILKVISATADSTFFFAHQYSVEKEYHLKKLLEKNKNDYYEDEEDILAYSREELQEMVNDKTICDILRD